MSPKMQCAAQSRKDHGTGAIPSARSGSGKRSYLDVCLLASIRSNTAVEDHRYGRPLLLRQTCEISQALAHLRAKCGAACVSPAAPI
eukprot:358671-Chlamydomonas_euryale.AAC.2